METDRNIDGTATAHTSPSNTDSAQSRHSTSNPSHYPFYHAAPALASSRYNRQLLIPQISLTGQQLISDAKVLIIGLGGLGSPASLYLAGAGVHTLGLLDHDIVEQSNLHRQIAHRESSIQGPGRDEPMSKVQSALRSCRELNHQVKYVAHEVRISGQNALSIIDEYDVVLDCTDNPATRYLISDCCVVLGKTLVSGAAQKLEGQLVVLNWPVYGEGGDEGGRKVVSRGLCYRCVFPHPPSPDLVKSCSEIGILGPVVGAIGTLMASETLKLIVMGEKQERKPTMLLYNAWSSDPRGIFRVIGLRGRRKDCVVCGEDEVLGEKGMVRITKESIMDGRTDYESWCGRLEDVKLLQSDERVDAHEFINNLGEAGSKRPIIVDVREEFEVELGPKVDGSINIPISRILRSSTSARNGMKGEDELDIVLQDGEERPIYFICQRGNDSQVAAKKLLDRVDRQTHEEGVVGVMKKRWIGDVRGGFMSIDKLANSG